MEECGGADRDRTCDLLIANETLYQLSYDPNQLKTGAFLLPARRLATTNNFVKLFGGVVRFQEQASLKNQPNRSGKPSFYVCRFSTPTPAEG